MRKILEKVEIFETKIEELEKQPVKKKYLSINFPYNLIQSTFNSYQKNENLKFQSSCLKKHNQKLKNIEKTIRKTIGIKIYNIIPFCQLNEYYALKFIKKLQGFTKEKYSFVIIWKAKNIRSLFNWKIRRATYHL